MTNKISVLAVEPVDMDIDQDDIPDSGIVSHRFILFKDLADDDLECLYAQSPEFVLEKRPDFVARKHPEHLH